jgi:hypothetical protein
MSVIIDGDTGIDKITDGSNQSTSATPYGRKNLIINGDMRIAQRGTSVTGVTSTEYRTVDRFVNEMSGLGTWTITQDTDVPTGQGFSNSMKLDCTSFPVDDTNPTYLAWLAEGNTPEEAE